MGTSKGQKYTSKTICFFGDFPHIHPYENDYWITTNIFLISTRDLSIIQTINVYNQSFSTCFLETFGNYDFFVFEDEYFTVKKQKSKCVCVRVYFMFFIFCVSTFHSACYIIMLSSLDNFNILDVQYADAIIVFIQKKVYSIHPG